MYPLKHEVTALLGDEKKQVKVFSVASLRFDNPQDTDSYRAIEVLEVIAPVGVLDGMTGIEHKGDKWSVFGTPEDHTMNPWFNPGMVRQLFRRPVSVVE